MGRSPSKKFYQKAETGSYFEKLTELEQGRGSILRNVGQLYMD